MRTLLGSTLLLCAAFAGSHLIATSWIPEHPAAAVAGDSGCTEAVLLRSTGDLLLTSCPPARPGTITHTAELP